MEWSLEMREVVSRLVDEDVEYGEGCDEACEHCPFAERCAACEGWWGCGAWEVGMGDDL